MYTYVYLQSMAGQQRVWVEVGPGSAFVCRLMDFNQYQGFISGNEVTFEEFQLTSILNEISVPRSGDWYVVMQGQGTYEVIVPPAPIADRYLPTLPWVNTTDKSTVGSPESHGQSQWQSKYENLAASQDRLPESLAPMFKPPKNAPGPLDSAKEQAQRVDQARADLEKAQAAFTGKLVSAYMGEKNNDAYQAAEKLFDARRALVAATRELEQSNLASFAVGRSPVPVPELPPDVNIQSFPQGESLIESLGKVNSKVSAATFGLIADIPADYRTATDWEDASTGEKVNLAIDIIGIIPIGGWVTKAGAAVVKVVAKVLDKAGNWVYKVFQRLRRTPSIESKLGLASKYASGNPQYPGLWPLQIPTGSGWKLVKRQESGRAYQAQITGVKPSADGTVLEFERVNPGTGAAVLYDGHVVRGSQEVFLDAKDGYKSMLVDKADESFVQNMVIPKLLKEARGQLDALPAGAILEWHVSDSLGADAMRKILEDAGYYGVDVIYTPKIS